MCCGDTFGSEGRGRALLDVAGLLMLAGGPRKDPKPNPARSPQRLRLRVWTG
jgi:hypothetical protein